MRNDLWIKLNYSSVAKKYRNILIDRYDLEENDTTDKTVLDLDIIGAYEFDNNFAGIPYTDYDSLTTWIWHIFIALSALLWLSGVTPAQQSANNKDKVVLNSGSDMALIMTVSPGFAGQKIVPTSFDKLKRTREMLLSILI